MTLNDCPVNLPDVSFSGPAEYDQKREDEFQVFKLLFILQLILQHIHTNSRDAIEQRVVVMNSRQDFVQEVFFLFGQCVEQLWLWMSHRGRNFGHMTAYATTMTASSSSLDLAVLLLNLDVLKVSLQMHCSSWNLSMHDVPLGFAGVFETLLWIWCIYVTSSSIQNAIELKFSIQPIENTLVLISEKWGQGCNPIA